MNGLMWNCRGLGGKSTIKRLNAQIRKFNPCFLFLSECKTSLNKAKKLINKIHGDWSSFCVPAIGLAGGIVLAWTNNLNVQILHSDYWYVHALVSGEDKSFY